MSRFYGGVEGNKGEATRQGSAVSGMDSYAQGWQSRIGVRFYAGRGDDRDKDQASVHLTGGPSNYSATTHYLNFPNIDAVIDALSANDPKIEAIWARIQRDLGKLNDEAPKAVARIERRRAAERQQRERMAA